MPTAQQIYDKYRLDPEQDMWDYSPLLRELAAGCRSILEIGVRDGVSTSAFLLGLEQMGGHLWSIDINPGCARAIAGTDAWTFIHGDSQDPESIRAQLPAQVDLLMIDGNHNTAPVRADLENYAPFVRRGGKILMHDVAPSIEITPEMIANGWHDLCGVRPAFEDYIRRECFAAYIEKGKFGLGVIQKTRVLVAALSCARDRELNQALRETCYRGDPYHRFFVGYPAELPDEITVDCPDDYEHLASKTQQMARCALAHDYDRVFKTDTDTYVDVSRLMRAAMQPPASTSDYCGFYRGGLGDYAKGLGYWLSRRALEIVADLPLRYSDDVHNPEPFLAEDRWVGHWLMARGIAPAAFDERYRIQEPGPQADNDVIAVHRRNKPRLIRLSHNLNDKRTWPL